MTRASEAYHHALTLGRSGRPVEALLHLQARQSDVATHAPSLALRGLLLTLTGRADEGLAAFRASVAIDDTQPTVHSDMGIALARLDRPQEAIDCFGRALALAPGNVAALTNRSDQWRELHQGEKALADADTALRLDPGLTPALRNRSRALLLLDRPQEALAAAESALLIDADDADSVGVKAMCLDALGRSGEAVEAFDQAQELRRPGSHDFTLRRALVRLRMHDFSGGWTDYEARRGERSFRPQALAWPDGEPLILDLPGSRKDVAGRSVLVVGEQGVGDQIMFASMIPDLIADAGRMAGLTDIRLQSLFEASFPDVRWGHDTRGLSRGDFDAVLPIGSLGALYRNSVDAFPAKPYLAPRSDTVRLWRERLGARTTPLRVGISWRGGVAATRRSARSISLGDLQPLLQRNDCEFISLQYGKASAEVEAFNRTLSRPVRLFPREDIENFEQLAGLVLALDLVISVQTSLIHLCGAVGAPCLVMIPFVAEWRYGDEGASMPWYGSVQLHRQAERGAWEPVIERIGLELDRRAAPAPA